MAPCLQVQPETDCVPCRHPCTQYIRTWLGTQINTAGTLSTHTDTNSTDGLIISLLQTIGMKVPLWETHTQIYNVDPFNLPSN